jgi:predicted kinase
VELACNVTVDEAIRRISSRAVTTSDATPRIASAIAHEQHTWVGAHPIDTAQSPSDSVIEAHEVCCLAL